MVVCTPEQWLFDIMFNIISKAKRFGKGEDVGLMFSLGAAGLTTLNMQNPENTNAQNIIVQSEWFSGRLAGSTASK